MHCDDASTLMDEVLDGRADSGRQAALLAHVADCAACGPEWQALQRLDRFLAAAPRVSAPHDFTAQVMAGLPRPQPAQYAWAGALTLLVGTIALAVVALIPFVPLSVASNPAALVPWAAAIPIQGAGVLVGWLQTGWEVRRAVLTFIPVSLLAVYSLFALFAVAVWLRLVSGIQGALRLIRE
jgi:anti-sigma factor RsiW